MRKEPSTVDEMQYRRREMKKGEKSQEKKTKQIRNN